MQKFNRVMIVLDWLFTMAVALLVLGGLARGEESLSAWLARLPRPALIISTVLLLLLNLIWLLLSVMRLGREEYVSFETSSGKVRTAVSAIEDSLTRTALAQPEVAGARMHVILGADGKTPARLVGNVSFVETPNQIAAQQVLQSVLLERFKEIVNVDKSLPVDINVVRFAAAKKGAAERKGRERPERSGEDRTETQEEFRGPRYPVGG